MKRTKATALMLALFLIPALFSTGVVVLTVISVPATGYDGGWNVSNVYPVIDDVNLYCENLGGTADCDNGGTDKLWFDTVTNDIDDNNGQDIPLDGIDVLLNNTANDSYFASFFSGTDFTIHYDEDTNYRYSFNFSWTIPNGFEPGAHYMVVNATDNQSAKAERGGQDNHWIYIYDYDPIQEELLASDGSDEDIDAGDFGNHTADPGDSDAVSVNFVRVKNVGGTTSQQFTIDWTEATWGSGGNTVNLNNNLCWRYQYTNDSTDNPDNNFVSSGSGWSDWIHSDSDGALTVTFTDNDQYVWIQYAVHSVPNPQPYGRYTATYTITAL